MFKDIIQRLFIKYFLSLSTVFIPISGVSAEFWNLPQQLSSTNSSITFEVDSTWHLVKGKAKELSGRLWLDDTNDFQSVRGEIRLPISQFDTDSESRDERMREVMNVKEHPEVLFAIRDFKALQCDPKTLIERTPCESALIGDLTINNTTRKVVLKTFVEKIDTTYSVVATTLINWADFNVEDPSILIAKLYNDVNINIRISLAAKK